jgi:hypothetical protein
MNDLPRSLESRSREWIYTPPQYRGACPGCGCRRGYDAKYNTGFIHGTGCWTSSHAHELVFGKPQPPCPECGGPPDTGAGHDCEVG